jgi:membrane-bound inhibitor of C-type lysozyme
MQKIYKKILGTVALWLPIAVAATPINDYSFKSPSFNGSGYSSHVLTIENQEVTRKAQVAKDIQAALDKAASAQSNTNIAKFMNNLESRIYAQISQNLATAMFANNNCTSSNSVGCSGTLNFEGNTIFWNKDSSNIYLQVTDTTGNQTTVTVPLGSFQFGN